MINNNNLKIIASYLTSSEWYKARLESSYLAALNAELTFTTKDEYLAWVVEWKKEYARISKESRQWKARRKLHHPEFDGLGKALTQIWMLRDFANAMLHLRSRGKRRSMELRNARLATQS